MTDVRERAARALSELGAAFARTDPGSADQLAEDLLRAGKIVCFGLGREGLVIRAFCMRLMHLGFDAHVAGDVTAPPVAAGDVVLLSTGPGDLLLARSMLQLAQAAAARTIALTAQPTGPDLEFADVVVHLPAQTMADDRHGESILPMGTAYEIAMLLFLDLVAMSMREMTGQTLEQIRARHTNLE